MINLYVMNVSPFEDSSLFSKGLSLIEKERQSKVNGLKKQDVKNLSLGAGLLLLYGLNLSTGFGGELNSYLLDVRELIENWDADRLISAFDYTYGPHGKPYVKGDNPIFFSLSHSGNYVLLAVSDKEIGADIQQRKEVHYARIASHFMTEKELELWRKAEEPTEFFYQVWAGKEAYLKLTGEGMTAGFGTVYLDEENLTMVDSRRTGKKVTTHWLELEEYQIAICQFT